MNTVNPTAQELKDKLKAIAEKSGKLSKQHPPAASTTQTVPIPIGQGARGGTIGGQ